MKRKFAVEGYFVSYLNSAFLSDETFKVVKQTMVLRFTLQSNSPEIGEAWQLYTSSRRLHWMLCKLVYSVYSFPAHSTAEVAGEGGIRRAAAAENQFMK
jgi:hypothetical protein